MSAYLDQRLERIPVEGLALERGHVGRHVGRGFAFGDLVSVVRGSSGEAADWGNK